MVTREITRIIFSTIFLFNLIVIAQTNNVTVEYYEMEGELTKSDLEKPEFGRYDGFELPMNNGEYAYFFVYSSDFNPSVVLVDPAGKVYLQKSSEGNDLVTINTKIPSTGNWYLYVLGENEDIGNYIFHYGFAGTNSTQISKNENFCAKLNFLVQHSKAHFVFLDQTEISDLPKLKGATETFLHSDDASYNSVLYDGNNLLIAEDMYENLGDEIKDCLGSKWESKINKFSTVGDHQEKSIEFSLSEGNKTKVVQLILTDFTNTAERFYNDYAVVILINSI